MARRFSYSGDPTASDLDWVRLETGDTDPTVMLLGDQEIVAKIAEYGSKKAALAPIIRLMLRQPYFTDYSRGSESETRSQRRKQLKETLAEAVALYGDASAAAVGAGISRVRSFGRPDDPTTEFTA